MPILTSVSGASGSYFLVDPAQSRTGDRPHDEAEPAATWPAGLFVRRSWSKKKTPEKALDLVREGAIVVRADVGRALVAGTRLETAPITVVMTDGAKVEGWVMLRVDDWVVGDDDPGEVPIARRVDAPRTLVATAEVAQRLARLTGDAIRTTTELARPFAPRWLELPYPPAEDARVAYAELRAGATGKGAARLRKAALAHPQYALAVALQLDRAAAADTRKAACAHPLGALGYALLVDRAAQPTTRTAADANAYAAYRYAHAFDRAISDELGQRMIASGAWDPPSLATEHARLADLTGTAPPPPLATRALPARPARPTERIAATVTDPEVRSDIDEMTGRGLARVGVAADAAVPEVIDALHRHVDAIRAGTVKLAKPGVARLELACAFAEQLHRAFAWQWTTIPDAVGVAAPGGTHAIDLRGLFDRIARKGARTNTLALLFNLIAAGDLPASKPRAFTSLS